MRITAGHSHQTLKDVNVERAKKKLRLLRAFVRAQKVAPVTSEIA